MNTGNVSRPKRRRPVRETPKPRPLKRDPATPKVQVEAVALVRVPGTPGKGGGVGGEKWRIEVAGARAGEVYVNLIDEPPLGRHASLQIYLNLKSQGRHIGRAAYAKACEMSQHDRIYAHMRRSNLASRQAALAAGFADATPTGFTQLILVWRRPSAGSKA